MIEFYDEDEVRKGATTTLLPITDEDVEIAKQKGADAITKDHVS